MLKLNLTSSWIFLRKAISSCRVSIRLSRSKRARVAASTSCFCGSYSWIWILDLTFIFYTIYTVVIKILNSNDRHSSVSMCGPDLQLWMLQGYSQPPLSVQSPPEACSQRQYTDLKPTSFFSFYRVISLLAVIHRLTLSAASGPKMS